VTSYAARTIPPNVGQVEERSRTAQVATLKITAHGFWDGMLVNVELVTNGADSYNQQGVEITVVDADHISYASPGSDEGATSDTGTVTATDLSTAEVALLDSIGSSSTFVDIEDDGSAIIAMGKLKTALVVYRETSIFLGGQTNRTDVPFAFDIIYGGTLGGDRTGCLAFPSSLVDVGGQFHPYAGSQGIADEYHLYAGGSDFYRLDLSNRTPQVFGPMHNVRNLLFDNADAADVDNVFAADNFITREVFFALPGKVIRYDYLFNTVSTSPLSLTAAAMIGRPVSDACPNDGQWFVLAL